MNVLAIIKRETEAQALADERGYKLNPWRLHGEEILRIRSAIVQALTWNQFSRWCDIQQGNGTFRNEFATVAKVTKSPKILALATEGLKLVERCEALSK